MKMTRRGTFSEITAAALAAGFKKVKIEIESGHGNLRETLSFWVDLEEWERTGADIEAWLFSPDHEVVVWDRPGRGMLPWKAFKLSKGGAR